MEAIEIEAQERKAVPQIRLNKYALASAILASTNSVLSGYCESEAFVSHVVMLLLRKFSHDIYPA